MNDAEVSKQVQQMVRFIRQEAEEKANEIAVSAEEEFNIEKLQIVEAEKRKIRQEYERKEKQLETRKKIDYSTQLNASRLKVLQAQDDVVQAMREAAEKQLATVSSHSHSYKQLLQDLIVQDFKGFSSFVDRLFCTNFTHGDAAYHQGLLRLREQSVQLRCRESDLELVHEILEGAKTDYMEKTNAEYIEVHVDEERFLPAGPDSKLSGNFCTGGVVLASKDGRIVCENTLDARLNVVFKQKLPEIRGRLFGKTGA